MLMPVEGAILLLSACTPPTSARQRSTAAIWHLGNFSSTSSCSKKPVSRLLYASDDALWLHEARPKNSQKLGSSTASILDADSICFAILNVLACELRTGLPQARAQEAVQMSARFRIGDLTLDTGRRLLLCDSKPIALGPLTYQLLLTLVEAAPNVVTHDELVRSIWGGRSVSPETISQRIKLLRDALSDDPHNPRYIEAGTRPGLQTAAASRGPAERIASPRSDQMDRADRCCDLPRRSRRGRTLDRDSIDEPVRESSSIAVLSFEDLSPAKDQQYLADGLAEEILNLLSKATTLRVVARTSSFSFKGKDADVRRIAEALGVTHVLEGSVRKAGDRIRVSVRLVDASDGRRFWSESYDRGVDDILALQVHVARSVAAELRANLQNLADVPARGVKQKRTICTCVVSTNFECGNSAKPCATSNRRSRSTPNSSLDITASAWRTSWRSPTCGFPWQRTEPSCARSSVVDCIWRRTIQACSGSALSWRGMTAISSSRSSDSRPLSRRIPRTDSFNVCTAIFKLDQGYPERSA